MGKFKECKRTKIEWVEVEQESLNKRKVDSVYIMMLVMKRHNAKTKDIRKHLYPIQIVKVSADNTFYQTKTLANGFCPICNKRTVFFFGTKTGVLKVKKCT